MYDFLLLSHSLYEMSQIGDIFTKIEALNLTKHHFKTLKILFFIKFQSIIIFLKRWHIKCIICWVVAHSTFYVGPNVKGYIPHKPVMMPKVRCLPSSSMILLINWLYQTSGDTWSEAPFIKIRCSPRRYGRGAVSY